MANSPYISFVVIAYNEERNIEPALSSIATLDGLSDYEIVVVNDGSADATGSIVRASALQDPHVRLIDLAANSGRGHARRTGVRAAQGHLVATVDADIVLPREWLNRTMAALTYCDAVGGVPVPDGDVAYIHRRFQLAPRVVPATSAVPGSNGLYRRTVFDHIEYDSSLREGEDSALNHAMKSRGLSLVTLPDLLVVHQERKTFRESLSWLFAVGKGATRQLIEYREMRQPDVATAALVLAMLAGVLIALQVSWIGIFFPIGLVVAVAVQHIRSRFHTPPTQWGAVALAVGADSVMLTAYFAGRLAGLLTSARRAASSGRT